MKICVFLTVTLFIFPALGQQFRVQKVKGNKAVIEFSGQQLTPGRSYSIGKTSSGTGTGSRDYLIGGSLNFNSGTYQTSVLNGSSPHKDLNISARFGWNFGDYEVGPLLSYRNIDSDYSGAHYSTLAGGAFFDYNMTPNRSGETHLFGGFVEGVFGTTSATNGASSSAMEFFFGGFFKWFGLGNNMALRGDLGYDYYKATASGVSGTLQGFVIRGTIATYF